MKETIGHKIIDGYIYEVTVNEKGETLSSKRLTKATPADIAASKKVSEKSKTAAQSTNPGSISPYDPKSGITQYTKPGTVTRSGNVSRAQHQIAPGVYGDTEIDVPTFMKNNPSWAIEFAKKHPGKEFDPTVKSYVKEFQEFYNTNTYNTSYAKSLEALKFSGLSDAEADKQAKAAAQDVVDREGFDPNYVKGKGNPRGIDSDFGQYTQSRVEIDNKLPEPAAEEIATADPGTQADHLQVPEQGRYAPWWLQDIIKTGHAAGNLARIKKYEPWQATADVYRPRTAFFDPNRELAANAEQSNIAQQTLAQFTGPQSFNARQSDIQGRGLRGAADTIGRVHNQNVDMSNRQEAMNADISNRAAQERAHQATTLWDKYQTVNQQFDNSKSQARDALVNQYVNAITNKNYTANLNKLYPQFSVNPAIGGEYFFDNPREVKANMNKKPDLAKTYNEVLFNNPHLKETKGGDMIALEIAKQQIGMAPNATDPYLDYQNRGVIPGYYPGADQE